MILIAEIKANDFDSYTEHFGCWLIDEALIIGLNNWVIFKFQLRINLPTKRLRPIKMGKILQTD